MDYTKEEWFESWFDTEWYHLLYCDRDESEAKQFITRLIEHLQPHSATKILDLACGKGRHALTLSQLGYHVWGIDLSEKSIENARKNSRPNLHFEVHDMRETYKPEYFDIIVNLFTSFGYFNDNKDNYKVMQSVWEGLKPNGLFVLDFLNARKVSQELVPFETVNKEGIEFRIERKLEDNVIVKVIEFEVNGKSKHFEERVTAFTRKDLEALFDPCNLKIKVEFGDYHLNNFNEENSDRLILIAEKVS